MAARASIRPAGGQAPRRLTAVERPPIRSYGLNEPDNYVVEEWSPTKRKLYESARRLFLEKGFAQTSVQEIVAGAGLTKGAFYHYFGAKEDLLRVIYERSLGRLARTLRTTITDVVVILRIASGPFSYRLRGCAQVRDP